MPRTPITLLFTALTFAAQGAPAPEIRFNRDIRPILSDKCFFCHGTDAKTREGDLRLDLRDSAIETGAIVPGNPGKSALVERIHSQDPDDLMPLSVELGDELLELSFRVMETAERLEWYAEALNGKPPSLN